MKVAIFSACEKHREIGVMQELTMPFKLKAYGQRLLLWLVLSALGAVLLARSELRQLREAFETDARISHRLLSQRAVQHEAVLATLALLQPTLQPGVADTAEQRLSSVYPQILSVQRRDPGSIWPNTSLVDAENASPQTQHWQIWTSRISLDVTSWCSRPNPAVFPC